MNFTINQKTIDIIKRLSAFYQEIDNKVFFVIFGGWAVDGCLGKVTRPHLDIDCICWRRDLPVIKESLANLGYSCEEFGLPNEPTFIYKIFTSDKIFTFQIIDKKPNEQFEISFYRFPHLLYPIKYLEITKANLNGINYPIVSEEFLINLKQREIDFYEKEKRDNPEKYSPEHQKKHFNCGQDFSLLKNFNNGKNKKHNLKL